MVGELLRLELNLAFILEHVTKLIVMQERIFFVAAESLGLSKSVSNMDIVPFQQKNNRIPLLRYRLLGSIPFDYVPTLDNDTSVVINRKPSKTQVEHWITFENLLMKRVLQTFLDVKSTVLVITITNR